MMNNCCKFGSQCAFILRNAVNNDDLESALKEISFLKKEISTLKRTFEALTEKKQDEESLRKYINDLQKEIETLQDINQETH